MRADYLILVCLTGLALLARPTIAADDAAPDAATPAASSSSAAAPASAVSGDTKESETLDVAESSYNNTAVVDEGGAESGERTNTKRTIDHNLGYGYRYNTVLRPVPYHHHHYISQPRRPMSLPMYKPQSRYPYHFYPGSGSGTGTGSSGSGSSGSGAPFRYSQPLPSPPREEPQHEATMSPRPVTEAPSGPHSETISLYRTLGVSSAQQQQQQQQQQQPEHQNFAYEDDLPKDKEPELEQQSGAAAGQPIQYADDAPHSYQQVLQADPTYILTSAAANPALSPASSMLGASLGASLGTPSLAAMYGHANAHPVMYATAGGASHAAATHMIPVIIVRLMDPHTAASASLGHAMSPIGHSLSPMGHAAAVHSMPYPLVNMQFLREYLSKLYAPAATAQHQYADPDPLVYSSPLFSSTQLQKIQLQQQLHAQLQKQLQMQVQQQQQQQHQQQQQRQTSSTVAALLQEQHRQRVAAAHAAQQATQQSRTEVTVHRSPAMSPQDYKESVEQQEEA